MAKKLSISDNISGNDLVKVLLLRPAPLSTCPDELSQKEMGPDAPSGLRQDKKAGDRALHEVQEKPQVRGLPSTWGEMPRAQGLSLGHPRCASSDHQASPAALTLTEQASHVIWVLGVASSTDQQTWASCLYQSHSQVAEPGQLTETLILWVTPSSPVQLLIHQVAEHTLGQRFQRVTHKYFFQQTQHLNCKITLKLWP